MTTPPKERFLNFASWIMQVVMFIDQHEHETGKPYQATDPEVELSLLSGMYRCEMTPEEAAATLTSTFSNVLTPMQVSIYLCALGLQFCSKKNGEIVGLVGKHADGSMTMIAGPQQKAATFLKEVGDYIIHIHEQIEKRFKDDKD